MRSPRPGMTQAGALCVEKGKTDKAGKRLLLGCCKWLTALVSQSMPLGYVATVVSEMAADRADSPNPAHGVIYEQLSASDVLCQHGIGRVPRLCAYA